MSSQQISFHAQESPLDVSRGLAQTQFEALARFHGLVNDHKHVLFPAIVKAVVDSVERHGDARLHAASVTSWRAYLQSSSKQRRSLLQLTPTQRKLTCSL